MVEPREAVGRKPKALDERRTEPGRDGRRLALYFIGLIAVYAAVAWGEPHADALLAAAQETLQLWSGGGLDYPDLAEDIALEARLALQLTEELKDLDERTTLLLQQADPAGILTSAPGVAAITAAAILGRLGDPTRFTSLAGVRAFTGLVPILDASGVNGRHDAATRSCG